MNRLRAELRELTKTAAKNEDYVLTADVRLVFLHIPLIQRTVSCFDLTFLIVRIETLSDHVIDTCLSAKTAYFDICHSMFVICFDSIAKIS